VADFKKSDGRHATTPPWVAAGWVPGATHREEDGEEEAAAEEGAAVEPGAPGQHQGRRQPPAGDGRRLEHVLAAGDPHGSVPNLNTDSKGAKMGMKLTNVEAPGAG